MPLKQVLQIDLFARSLRGWLWSCRHRKLGWLRRGQDRLGRVATHSNTAVTQNEVTHGLVSEETQRIGLARAAHLVSASSSSLSLYATSISCLASVLWNRKWKVFTPA